jgi:hypothetical protein
LVEAHIAQRPPVCREPCAGSLPTQRRQVSDE